MTILAQALLEYGALSGALASLTMKLRQIPTESYVVWGAIALAAVWLLARLTNPGTR